MFWNYLILILGIISSLYALPYGKWELEQKNTIGGITVYVISIAGIILMIAQILV